MIDFFNVQENEFFNPSINEIDYLDNCAGVNCEDNYFYWFVFKCVFNNNFINATNDKKLFFKLILDMENIRHLNPMNWM